MGGVGVPRCESGTEKIIFFEKICFGSGVAWKHFCSILVEFRDDLHSFYLIFNVFFGEFSEEIALRGHFETSIWRS